MTSPRTTQPTDGPFLLTPVSKSVQTWLFLLAFLLPVLVTAAAQGMILYQAPVRSAGMAAVPMVIMPLVALGVWWMLTRGIARRRVALVGNSIEVTTLLARERIPLAELDLVRARVADLGERTELQPLLKLWGAGLPGLRSGWFLLRNRRRTLVAMAGGKRVLWLPTRKRFDLLLEMQQPQAALEALRERA
jgi:hypothetical protein